MIKLFRTNENRTERFINQRSTVKNSVFVLFVIVMAVVLIIEIQIRPVAKAVIKNKAEVLSSEIVDDAITESVCKSDISYSDIVTIKYNDKNEVLSINTNIALVNKIKADISSSIHEKLASSNNKEVAVPIGSLMGVQLLEGRGFDISFYINLTGSANVNLVSSFTDAGINQTKHCITVDIEANITALGAGCCNKILVKSSAVLAETVIIGAVPELYSGPEVL